MLLHKDFKESLLYGRYLNTNHIDILQEKHKTNFHISSVGSSVEGKKIISYSIGDGPIKILMWSQMHGNESTTTKALFDLFNFLLLIHRFMMYIKNLDSRFLIIGKVAIFLKIANNVFFAISTKKKITCRILYKSLDPRA